MPVGLDCQSAVVGQSCYAERSEGSRPHLRVVCSRVVSGRGKFELGWFTVAGVVRVVGVAGVWGVIACFESRLFVVAGVVRVAGVVGIAVLFSENGVPVNGCWSWE